MSQCAVKSGQLPVGWKVKRLDKVLKLDYGKPLPKDQRDDNGKFPAYGANGIKCRTNRFYWDKPTIIVGRKGSAGEVNLTENKFWPLDVTYFVNFDEHEYNLKFLYFCLVSLHLPKLAKGVKPGINRNDVYDIEFAFPPLPEQKRIVAILDEAFSGIAQAVANAEKNLANAREVFESYLNGVFARRGEGWVDAPIEEHIKFIDYRGRTPRKTNKGIRLITAKNVKMGFLQLEPQEFVDPKIYEDWMIRGIPKKGDVLFTTEAPLGNVAQLDTVKKVVFAQRVIIMQPNREMLKPTFLKYIFLSRTFQFILHEKATGATTKGIKASLLKKIPISIPPISEQKDIIKKLDTLKSKTQNLETIYKKKLTALSELKQSILQKAFTGELTADKIQKQANP